MSNWPRRRRYEIDVTVPDSDTDDRLSEILLNAADLVDPGNVSMSAGPAEDWAEEDAQTRYGTVADGFGSEWIRCGPNCDLQVVRPGKVQCNETDPSCPNRED